MTRDSDSEDSLDDPIRLFDSFDFECIGVVEEADQTNVISNNPDQCTNGELEVKLDQGLLLNTTDLPAVASNDTRILCNSSSNAEIVIDVSKYFRGDVNNKNLIYNSLNETDVSHNSTTETNGVELIDECTYIEDNRSSAPDKDLPKTRSVKVTKTVDLSLVESIKNKGFIETCDRAKKVSIFKDLESQTVPQVDIYERIIGTAYENVKTLRDLSVDHSNNRIQNNNINNDSRNIEDYESIDKFRRRRCSVTDLPSKGIRFGNSPNKKRPKRISRSNSLLVSSQKNQNANLNDSLTKSKSNNLSKCKETSAKLKNKTNANSAQIKENTITSEGIYSKPERQNENNKFNVDNPNIQLSTVNSNEPIRATVLRYATSVPKARRNTISCSSPNDTSNIASFKVCKNKFFSDDKIIPHYHKHKVCNKIQPIELNPIKGRVYHDHKQEKCIHNSTNKLNSRDTDAAISLSNGSSTQRNTNNNNNNYVTDNIFETERQIRQNDQTTLPSYPISQDNLVVTSIEYGTNKTPVSSYENASSLISATPKVTYTILSTKSSDVRKVTNTSMLNLDKSRHDTLVPNTHITRDNDSIMHQSIPVISNRNKQSNKHNLSINTDSTVFDSSSPNCSITNIPLINTSTQTTTVSNIRPIKANCSATCNFDLNMNYTDINNRTENSGHNLDSLNNFSAEMPYDCATSLIPGIYSSQLQNMESAYINNYNFSNNIGSLRFDPSVQFLGYNQYPTYPIDNTNNRVFYQIGPQIATPQSTNNFQTTYWNHVEPLSLNDFLYNQNIPLPYSGQLPSYGPSIVNETNYNNTMESSQAKPLELNPKNATSTISTNQSLLPKSLNIIDSNKNNSTKDLEILKEKSKISNFSKISQEQLSNSVYKKDITNKQRKTDKSTTAVKYNFTSYGDYSTVRNDNISRDKVTTLQSSNSIDSTKYPAMVKLLNMPLEKNNSSSNVSKTFLPHEKINSKNYNDNREHSCTEYSPPILPILSFEAIFEKMENENFLIPYNEFNFIKTFYPGQDPYNLENKKPKMKEKETKRITLDEYKRKARRFEKKDM